LTGKELACGGVVIDAAGRVLLREPSGHFDGYVWTFPKGRPYGGETPEQTALRETQEETGVVAEIVDQVPGSFPGGTTDNIYFLMRPTGRTKTPDMKETASVLWTPPDKTRELIGQTTNLVGRARDLAVLEAAIASAVASRRAD
jgi:ADP-ribose pyrophosphatase YjhB (NUDIX family)